MDKSDGGRGARRGKLLFRCTSAFFVLSKDCAGARAWFFFRGICIKMFAKEFADEWGELLACVSVECLKYLG